MEYIKKLILHSGILIGLGTHVPLYATWKEHMTVVNILTLMGIVVPITMRIYDEARKDPHQEERVKVLTRQQIMLNKQDLDKGDQRVGENKLYLQKKELEIEKERYQINAYKLDLQVTTCAKYIDAVKKLAEIVPLTSSTKRAGLQEKIDAEVELLVHGMCGFKARLKESAS